MSSSSGAAAAAVTSATATIRVKQEKEEDSHHDEDKGRDGRHHVKAPHQIQLLISMDIELMKPVVKKEQPQDCDLDDSSDTLPVPKDEIDPDHKFNPDEHKDFKKFNLKQDGKAEDDSDNSATDMSNHAGEDTDEDKTETDSAACPDHGDDDSGDCHNYSITRKRVLFKDDTDSDSDYEDEEFAVRVKDVLTFDEVEQMLARCQRIIDLDEEARPDPPDKTESKLIWSIPLEKREKRIPSISIFTDNRLNQAIRSVLLLPDSQSCLIRAVQYLTFIFWGKHKLKTCYLPDMLTCMPEIRFGQMPLHGYKMFFAIFMHIHRIQSPAKFESNPLIDLIVAEVNQWETWFLFKSSKSGKRHKSAEKQTRHSRKRVKQEEDSDSDGKDTDSEEEEDDELRAIRDRCRKRLHRQPSEVDVSKEILWPRIYDLDGSLKTAGRVFHDRKLHSLLRQLLLTEKSKSSLSGAVDNLGRILWSRQEILDMKFPSPKDLLQARGKADNGDPVLGKRFLKHSVLMYKIIMRIQGRYRNVREFAGTKWAEDVCKSFRMKFTRHTRS